MASGPDPTPAGPGSQSGAESGSRFRLLVVATNAVGPQELGSELRRRAAGRQATVRIVAPAIVGSAFQHAAGDVDEGIADAQERLEETASRLRDESIEVESYKIGDSDPLLAIGDELRAAPADEVLIVTHPDEDAGWLEDDLFDRARKQLEQPITHVTVGEGAGDRVRDVESSGAGTDPDEAVELGQPDNMPRLTARDVAGIAIAILGTLALFVLAADCIDEPRDAGTASCSAQLLIAGATGLINLAHLVGMVLTLSVGYRGFPERWFSRFSMIGTPLAIVAVLVIKAAT